MRKKRLAMAAALCIGLAVMAGVSFYAGSRTAGDQKRSAGQEEKDKLTIWLDRDSEYDLRYQTAIYKKIRQAAQGTDKEPYFTYMDFELVPKNYLSPQQYREELDRALEAGEGPDIIYMDEYNGVNPLELLEAGRLAPLEGEITKRFGDTLAYASGSLEAGMRDGKNYVLPIAMECPVVFGIKEELEAAGIQTERMYGSLEEFLDALLAAQEKTGKMIFESPEAADWLEQYYLAGQQEGDLSEKLAMVRAHSGEDAGRFGAYEMLSEGECLLGGCGIYDYKMLGMNASLLGDRQLALLSIPDSSGSMQGLITNAAAVRADSPNAGDACQAVLMFQAMQVFWPDISVIDQKGSGSLENASTVLLGTPSVRAFLDKGLADGVAEQFAECSVRRCGGVSYVQEYEDRIQEAGISEVPEKAFSICFADMGEGDGYPAARWLNGAAAAYMQDSGDAYVQLLPRTLSQAMFALFNSDIEKYGEAPDAVIASTSDLLRVSGIRLDEKADFSRMLEEAGSGADGLQDMIRGGIRLGKSVIGLPVQVREYGAWVSRRTLEKAGLAEDWRPADATELAAGMERLAEAAGPSYVRYGSDTLTALALFAEPENLLAEQEDGSICCSRDGWASALAMFKSWKDAGTAQPVKGIQGMQEAMQDLAEGRTGMVLDSSSLSGYVDGAYGTAMTQEQQEDLVFWSLSPAADADSIFASSSSGCIGEVYAFWQEALQRPDYAECIRADSCIPVTEMSENVRQFLPMQKMKGDFDELWNGLWNTDMSAEELAEKYPLYEWAED